MREDELDANYIRRKLQKKKEMLDLRSEHATFCSIRVVLMYLRARKRNTNQMPKHNLMKYKWNILERMRKVPASES